MKIVTSPFNHLWYIISLICWRVLLYFIPKERIVACLALSLILALVIGFIPFPLYAFSVSRTVVFFPYFLLGFYFKANNLLEKLRNRLNTTIAWLTIAVAILLMLHLGDDYSHYFWGNQQYNNTTDIVIRLVVYIVAVSMSLCIFAVSRENSSDALT